MNSAKRKSFIEPNKSIDETIKDRIIYVIENKVRQQPYIALLSKKQLYNNDGFHFKNAKDPGIQAGLLKHLNIRIPRKVKMEEAERFYGYPALIGPWGEMNNIVNRAFRNKILINTQNGNHLNDVRVMLGKGYINEDGTLDNSETTGISVYVLFLADREYRPHQNEWIRNQKDWVKYQIARNQDTHASILIEKSKQAKALVRTNKNLLTQNEYKELDPGVDRQALPWEFDIKE